MLHFGQPACVDEFSVGSPLVLLLCAFPLRFLLIVFSLLPYSSSHFALVFRLTLDQILSRAKRLAGLGG